MGRSQLSAVRSAIIQGLAHDLKIQAWPQSHSVPGWQSAVIRFRQEAAEAFATSMRQHIDMAQLYALAIRRLPATIDGQLPWRSRRVARSTLDALLAVDER